MKKFLFYAFLCLGLVACLYSCKHHLSHNVRQSYTDVNAVLHKDSLHVPFFKAHFKDGNVAVLEGWSLNNTQDSVFGSGRLYDLYRHNIENGILSFAIDDIAIIETNDLEQVKSKDGSRVAALTILTAVNLALDAACALNPKACFGSCPTFYVDGSDIIHGANAEGFSNAISPALEYGDIDALQHSTSKEHFQLTMKNEAFETHMVNQVYLHAVLKNRDEHAFHDSNGNYYKSKDIFSASEAKADGIDVLGDVLRMDNNEYFSATDSFDLTSKEELILEFDNLPDEELGIVINHKQTLLTTFLLYSGISYMGDEVGDYFAKIETDKRIKKKLGSPFKKLGGIKMFAWNYKTSRWDFIEELYETGPIANNLKLSPIRKNLPRDGKMRIKLEMSKGLWRVDYVGLTSINDRIEPLNVFPSEIEVITGSDYTINDIIRDDEDYLVSFPGDEFNLMFDFPKIDKNQKYELFLSVKGYYLEWMRKSWLDGKDLPRLRKMLLHDRNTWRELAIEFKTMEKEMETVFWNSKYSVLQ